MRLGSLLYLLTPIAVWLVLRRRHDVASLRAWCVGAGLHGVAGVLMGYRGEVADVLSIHLANLLMYASLALRMASLRMECRRSPGYGAGAFLVVLAMVLVMAGHAVSPGWRVMIALLLQGLATLALGWTAHQLWRGAALRWARGLSWAHVLLAAGCFTAVYTLGLGGWNPQAGPPPPSVAMSMLLSFAGALYGNLAFMGMATERAHLKDLAQARELARESQQRASAEEEATRLGQLLEERDDLLRVLAHEVRQPLNNASAALQAAQSTLSAARTDPELAAQRIQRAAGVLSQIGGMLDNTLAKTALLASPERVECRDVDVETLTALAVGDLDPTQRWRVRVDNQAVGRTALMDAGLMRLALRNLLSNALAYSDPGTEVLLQVTDSDEPLALVLEVCDRGRGIEPALAGRLFKRGARGSHGLPGHGLGLYLVGRVLELHGGSVEQQARPGGGTVFRVVLPQGMHDRRSEPDDRAEEAALAALRTP